MEINNKRKPFSHIRACILILLFVMLSTVSGIFCGAYHHYELSDKTAAIETWELSASFVANQDRNYTADDKDTLLDEDRSGDETITKNTSSILMFADIPSGISLLFIFSILFILLPDGWTLINQKVRLDN